MSFRDGDIYIALRLVSFFDKDPQEYQRPVPKITFFVDGKYIHILMDSKWLRKFGEFIIGLSEVIDSVDVDTNSDARIDIESLKRKMEQFRGCAVWANAYLHQMMTRFRSVRSSTNRSCIVRCRIRFRQKQ